MNVRFPPIADILAAVKSGSAMGDSMSEDARNSLIAWGWVTLTIVLFCVFLFLTKDIELPSWTRVAAAGLGLLGITISLTRFWLARSKQKSDGAAR